MLIASIGAALILVIIFMTFETVVLPRSVSRRWQAPRRAQCMLWRMWSRPVRRWRGQERREAYLSVFGPSVLIVLLGVGIVGLVLGFALVHWGLDTRLDTNDARSTFAASLYGSGTTFATLGLGDVVPHTGIGRLLVVLEAAMGMGFLALVIAYVPILNQAFFQREVHAAVIDARAGSPPSALELLRRHAGSDQAAALAEVLTWSERWAAELLESHLSYPILAYFRSQHYRQSWLSSIATILDVSALIIVGLDEVPPRGARTAFAVSRHTVADLSHALGARPHERGRDRLPPAALALLREELQSAGIRLRVGPEADDQLRRLRRMYEPFVSALADLLLVPLPHWLPTEDARDAWQTTLWQFGESEPALDLGWRP